MEERNENIIDKLKGNAEKMKKALDESPSVLSTNPNLRHEPTRGFEIVSDEHRKFPKDKILFPLRSTLHSAGYDLYSNEDVDLKSMTSYVFWTDIKAFMQTDEVLKVFVRSSLGFKHTTQIANGTGIIDADYYNNSKNDGNIGVCLVNLSKTVVKIKKGDRIAQCIFQNFLEAETGYESLNDKRDGGVGSTD